MTDRGVSTTVGYVLTLGIATILVSGLLIATGGVVENRTEATARDGLEVVGQRLAANLMSADRLAETRNVEAVALEVALPRRLAGSGYSIHVDGVGSVLLLESEGADVQRRISFVASTPVVTTNLRGGPVRIVLTPAGDLEVRAA